MLIFDQLVVEGYLAAIIDTQETLQGNLDLLIGDQLEIMTIQIVKKGH